MFYRNMGYFVASIVFTKFIAELKNACYNMSTIRFYVLINKKWCFMNEGEMRMHEVVLKSKKNYNPYMSNETLFFDIPHKVEESSLSLIISCKIVANLSRDMEEMTNLMVKSILEGVTNGKR